MHLPTKVERLIELGFVEAGSWALQSEKPCVSLNGHCVTRPALYALVENDAVVYVGKTIRTLKHRMGEYERPGPSQKTSLRNHASITSSMARGCRVRVFVLKCDAPMQYRGVTVNLAAGLEDPLIALFKPEWNLNGKS